MPGIEVTIRGTDLLIQNDPSKPNCDSISRRSIAGTLEYLRMEDVCRVNLTNYESITSDEGYATFDTFTIGSGPQVTSPGLLAGYLFLHVRVPSHQDGLSRVPDVSQFQCFVYVRHRHSSTPYSAGWRTVLSITHLGVV